MEINFTNIERPREVNGTDKLVDYLVHLPEGEYDSKAAALFAAASAWAYSDVDTFARMLCRRGLYGQCLALKVGNDALLVDTTAFVFQSHDQRLLIVCARGTQPTNLINWLTDATVRMDPFAAAGHVHGGFFRAGLVLWPTLSQLLLKASRGAELQEIHKSLMGTKPLEGTVSCEMPEGEVEDKVKAIYFCGHSLGGALVVLAAAGVYLDMGANLNALRDTIHAIYTYGQPMLADETLADTLEEKLGKKLFRHVYGRDIVPRLPPRTAGNFKPFGQEYTSEEGGWVRGTKATAQAKTIFLSTVIGALAWIKEQVPFLRWLRLPFSWDHHSPIFYMRTSEAFQPGHEVL